ncbi:MAG: rhomboid family intramembrane serine protease [Labilithrix sp.]|nr:rhomboid family intramembrane serine protease [Labilithrix sp.]MCW5815484.1 rhomboid family intramembrane serine protease [Labilithrix sp.]
MERLLALLERRLGRFAIPNLTMIVVGGMAFTFMLLYTKPELIEYLVLDQRLALKQPWRFITYLFIPRSESLFWILFSLYWTWLVGTNLESEWGAFKLNVYYVIGILGTTAAAWITGQPQGNFWLNTSLFFAFATIFPSYEILLFFIVPIRVKWLAFATAALLGWFVIDGDNGTRAAIVVAFANYLLFFGGHLLALARGQQLQMKQAARRASFRRPARDDDDDRGAKSDSRACAICGKRQDEGADIRVCSCEKCGGPRELCLEHARDH